MSRCAHLSPWVNLPRKVAAVMAPPSRPPTLAKSAKLLLSCSAYSSVSGSCQQRSSARCPASSSSPMSAWALPLPLARAGEGRDVDHRPGVEAARIVQRIAQDEPPLGVRVENLDGLPRGAGDDVTGLHRAAARHVLHRGDEADEVQRQ